MSLDISATRNTNLSNINLVEKESTWEIEQETIFSLNITHNLNKLADAANFYKQLWHLEGITTCEDLLPHIEAGIVELESNPTKYKQFSAKNNWGTYEQFLPWLKDLAEKLKIEPTSNLFISR